MYSHSGRVPGINRAVIYMTAHQLSYICYVDYRLHLTKIPYQFLLTHGGKKQQSKQTQLHYGQNSATQLCRENDHLRSHEPVRARKLKQSEWTRCLLEQDYSYCSYNTTVRGSVTGVTAITSHTRPSEQKVWTQV